MPIHVWTSTKNQVDREEEDVVLEKQSDIYRVSPEKLNALGAVELDFIKRFNCHMQATLPPEFLTKILPEALKICEDGLDLELRHLLLELTGNILKVYAGSSTRLHIYKVDLSNTEADAKHTLVDFRIALSCSDVRTVLTFINKSFLQKTGDTAKSSGRCSIGVKLNDRQECENLLLACYTYEAESDNIPPLTPKTSLFKLERHVGESPLPLLIPNSTPDNYYKVKIKPTTRWSFPKTCDYVEFVHSSGIMEIRYASEDASTRSSLGGHIESDMDLPHSNTAMAAANGGHFFAAMSYIKSDVTIRLGYVEADASMLADSLMIDSSMLTAYIAQSHKIALPTTEVYVTKKKNKVVETTQEEATFDALRRNKVKKKEAEALSKKVASKTTYKSEEDEDSDDVVENKEELKIVSPPAPVDKELPSTKDELCVIGPPGYMGVADPTKCIIEAVPSFVQHDKVEELRQEMNDKFEELKELILSSKRVNHTNKTRVRGALFDDTDKVAEYLKQCTGEMVKTSVIKNILPDIKPDNIYHVFYRFNRAEVILKVKRGSYTIPEDFEARYEAYKNSLGYDTDESPKEEPIPEEDDGKDESTKLNYSIRIPSSPVIDM